MVKVKFKYLFCQMHNITGKAVIAGNDIWQVHVCVSMFSELFYIQKGVQMKGPNSTGMKNHIRPCFTISFHCSFLVTTHVFVDIIPTTQYHAMGK